MNKKSQLRYAGRFNFVSRVGTLLIIALLGACASPLTSGRVDSAGGSRPVALASPASAEVIQALAPTGVLRVGAYPGSPTSMVRDASNGQQVGLTFEMGQMLAKQLGVPMQLVEYSRVAQVIEGVKTLRSPS
jgi:polar amino acid transport system substrate-binding protein